MMGHRQVEQAALFYEFSLERHIPTDHLLRSIDRFVDLEQVRQDLAPSTVISVGDPHHRRGARGSGCARRAMRRRRCNDPCRMTLSRSSCEELRTKVARQPDARGTYCSSAKRPRSGRACVVILLRGRPTTGLAMTRSGCQRGSPFAAPYILSYEPADRG